jgi:hypothetical protein
MLRARLRRIPRRAALLVGLVSLGSIAFLLFGPEYGACLGPLGVTEVQCAAATGVIPASGPGLPIFIATIALASLVLRPIPRRHGTQAAAAAAAFTIGGCVLFLQLRARTMEGFDSAGRWISIARPVDGAALVAVAMGAGLVGVVLIDWLLTRKQRTSARDR